MSERYKKSAYVFFSLTLPPPPEALRDTERESMDSPAPVRAAAAAPSPPALGTFNQKNPAIRRILADARELSRDPSDQYAARCDEDNMFEWHFVVG